MESHQSSKYGFVYIWYDRKHKRYYIGSHWGTEDDGYVCSSNWMRNAKRRRPSDFKRRILTRIDTNYADLLAEENRWLSMIKPQERKIRYYNLSLHSGHWRSSEEKTLELKEIISKSTKKAMYRPDIREKYLEGLSNRENISAKPDVREKKRQTMKKNFIEGKINPIPPSQKGKKWWNNGKINKFAKIQPEGFISGAIQIHTEIHLRNKKGQFIN